MKCLVQTLVGAVLVGAVCAAAAAQEANSAALPPGATMRLGSSDLRHSSQVLQVAVSPDRRRAASISSDKVFVWDLATGKAVFSTGPGANYCTGLTFAGDSNTIAWVAGNSEVRVVSCGGGDGNRSFSLPRPSSRFVRASADGRFMACAAQGGVDVVRVADGNVVASFNMPNYVNALAISREGNAVAVTHYDNGGPKTGVYLVGKEEPVWTRKANDYFLPACFSPDGLRVAGWRQSRIVFLDARTGQDAGSFEGGVVNQVTQLAFLGESNCLAGQNYNGLYLWDANGHPLSLKLDLPSGSIQDIAVSPDGNVLATAGPGAMVGLWSLQTGKPLFPMRGHVGYVTTLGFRGGSLVSGGQDGTLRLWDLARGDDEPFSVARPSQWLAVSPRGTWAVAQTRGRTGISVWDLARGVSVRDLAVEGGTSWAAVSWDDQLLAAGDYRSINVWHILTGRLVRHIDLESAMRSQGGMAFTPDGGMIILGGAPEVRLMELATGKMAAGVCSATSSARSLSITRDGRRLAVIDGKDLVLVDMMRPGNSVPVPGAEGYSVAISADGRRLAVGQSDGTILLWDAPGPPPSAASRPADADLPALWEVLTDADAEKAYQAERQLVSAGPAAVKLLRDKLKPLPAGPGKEELARLLADLDSDSFRTRDAASAKLAAVGELPFLLDSFAAAKSDEVRARLNELLADFAKLEIKDPADLRNSRAIRVLEVIGDAAAREALKALAAGGPGRLTRAAAEAISRLTAPAVPPASTTTSAPAPAPKVP